MTKTFNIYCDESCRSENDRKPFMFSGSISSAYNQVRLHTEQITEPNRKHNFYAESIDCFFATDLKFRAAGIEKSKLQI